MAKLKKTVIVGGLSGSSGPVTFKLTKEGTMVTERSSPSNPSTSAQVGARTRLRTAAQTFRGFTQTQEDAWKTYAQSVQQNDPITGGKKALSAISAYIRLATKFLQVNNGGTPPSTPPANAYSGDPITVTATATTGKVTFTASAANTLATKTELLLQPLASKLRNPAKNGYRTKAFVQFAAGSLSFDVNVPPGWFAAGYRFVSTATGQMTPLIPIGVHQVTLAVEQGGSKKKAA